MAPSIVLPLVSLTFGPIPATEDAAEPEPAAWLVAFDELEARLDDPNRRLIDVRSRADYEAGHIPGAVWVDLDALKAQAAKPGGLTDRAFWETWLARLGLGPETEVLVYDANRQRSAARLWWLLTYLGVERVGLINGGFPLWASEGRPVTTEVPEIEPKAFPVAFQKERHATRDDVLDSVRSKSAFVVDARSKGEFTGEIARSERGGHVPDACHLEWSNLVDEHGRFIDKDEARRRLEAAGVMPGAPVITHCQGGGRASVNAFVLERLGFRTKNYYLGWSDWGNAEETPVETGRPDPEEPRR